MKKLLLTSIGILSTINYANAEPPEPEVGERWIINPQYSDEFNGTELDRSKWKDQFGGWQGRRPARFEENTISVKNGNMQIKNGVLVDGTTHTKNDYSISGGAVQSAKETAHYGYYECKFKSSKINMSTTFWLSSTPHPLLETSRTDDKFSQELDICESIGGTGDFSKQFREQMKFNTHYRVRDCRGCKEQFFSRGNNQIEIRNGTLVGGDASLGGEAWEDFHTYAGYWKNAKEVTFYVDNRFIGTVNFRTDISQTPFEKPMRINMVTETYDWATPYPTNDQLRNNSINTSFYDWIRSYQKIGIEDTNPYSSATTQATYAPIFNEEIKFFEAPKLINKKSKIEIAYLYKANTNREFRLHIFDRNEIEVFETSFQVLEGFGKNIKTIDLPNQLPGNASDYSFLGEIREIGSDSNGIVSSTGDTSVLSINSVVKNTLKATFYPNPTSEKITIQVPNSNGLVEVEIFNAQGKSIHTTNFSTVLSDVEISYLASGIYFLKVTNSGKTTLKKLIIK